MDKVQDFLINDLLEIDTGDQQKNETVELMEFVRDNSVAMSQNQVQAFFLLKENGLTDIADFVYNARRTVTPYRRFLEILNKLTLADRIKGNAKLSHLLKASANPAGDALKPKDVQAQGMSKKEIGGI